MTADAMILKQRSHEWRVKRYGAVTSSGFQRVLADAQPKGIYTVAGERGSWKVLCRGATVAEGIARKTDAEQEKAKLIGQWRQNHWSVSAETYLDELLAELLYGIPLDTWQRPATEWGTENEPEAFQRAIPVLRERFGAELSLPEGEYAYIQHPTEPYIGCSPDGIVGDDGLLEIKCPYNAGKWIAAKRHGLLLVAEHKAQVQGSLWITGRSWYAYCWFDPRAANAGFDPLLLIRVERDNEYIDQMAPRILAFRDYLRAEYERLKPDEPF